MQTWGLRWWPIFLLISTGWLLTGFGIPEGIALASNMRKHVDNTLSQYLRHDLHVDVAIAGNVHTLVWWITFVLWMAFAIWFTDHIWFGQFG